VLACETSNQLSATRPSSASPFTPADREGANSAAIRVLPLALPIWKAADMPRPRELRRIRPSNTGRILEAR